MKVWKICLPLAVFLAAVCFFAFREERTIAPAPDALERDGAVQGRENPDQEEAQAVENAQNEPSDHVSTKEFVLERAPALAGIFPANQDSPQAKAADLGNEIIVIASGIGEKLTMRALSPRDMECTDEIFQGIISKGDTVAKILENADEDNAQPYVRAMDKIFSLKAFRAGQPYVIITDPATGKLKRFEYEVNDTRRLVVEGMDSPRARFEAIDYETTLESASGLITDNLFQTVADIGESPQLALRLVDLFGSEINFIRDLQEGDSFSVLIEKRYRDGDYKGYGRILAASFTNKGKLYEAFLFNDGSGKPGYYNAKGENLKKTLLQSPLAFTRVTSRFSHNRKHPILGGSRPHLGVDYGAPTGTPVKAVGDGTVTKRGWAGGYGNQIILRHGSGLESMYAHLSGFARGLRQGQKVRQGQVIGFVGSTGLSTGPHLDFRLRQNNVFINPLKAINPRGAPVATAKTAEFNRVRDLEKDLLNGVKIPANYTVDSIVPLIVSSDTRLDTGKNKEKSIKKVIKAKKQRQPSRKARKNKTVRKKKRR